MHGICKNKRYKKEKQRSWNICWIKEKENVQTKTCLSFWIIGKLRLDTVNAMSKIKIYLKAKYR